MGRLEELFTTVLNMSVTAGVVILVILALRALLRKTPRKYLYALWIVAAVRLVCPWAGDSGFSVFNLGIFEWAETGGQTMTWHLPEYWQTDVGTAGEGGTDTSDGAGEKKTTADAADGAAGNAAGTGIDTGSWTDNKTGNGTGIRADGDTGSGTVIRAAGDGADSEAGGAAGASAGSTGRTESSGSLLRVFALIWSGGVVLFLLYQLWCWQNLKKRIRYAARIEENVYECSTVGTPFVMGIVSPRIYLPPGLTGAQKKMILLHERCHIRRGDHIVKILAVAILAVYWFHPLVWAAFFCMTADMEMSCDEAVLERLGSAVKADYGECLLGFAVKEQGMTGVLAFGESSVGRRIRNILNFRRKGQAAAVISVVVCIAAGLILLTNASDKGSLSYSGYQRYSDGDRSTEHRTHAMNYQLDRKTKSVAIYRELWTEGELEDYELLAVRGVGDGENEFPGKGRLTAERNYDFTDETSWMMDTCLYLELSAGGARQALSDTYRLSGDLAGGVGESFRVDENNRKTGIGSEGDLVIAAYHIGYRTNDGSGGMYSFTCEDLDSRSDGFYWNRQPEEANSQELIYRMAVSEQPYEELAEQYKVSPYTAKIFAAKTPYAGDAPAVMNLLEMLYTEELGRFTIELQTGQEPYGLTLEFQEEPEDPAAWNLKMEKKAILALALVDNLGEVEWNHPAEDGTRTYRWIMDPERARDLTGISDLKSCGESAEELQKLWSAVSSMERTGTLIETEYTGDGWRTEEGEVYPYRYFVAGMLPNASYAGVAEILAEEADVTYEEAFGEVLSSTYEPGKRKARIIWIG